MWHAADLQDKMIHHAPGYKFDGLNKPHFDWAAFKPQRDAYIRRLNNIYANNFEKEGVEFHQGFGHLTSPNTVEVKRPNGQTYTLKADHITVAVGGEPIIPSDNRVPGASLGIDSDGFFDITQQPKRVAVIGAGYIAVELAGIFRTLGSEVHMFIRGETVLRTFDPSLQEVLTPWMEKTGVSIHKKASVTKIEGERGKTLTVHTGTGDKVDVDLVLWAIGRRAVTHGLGLEELGVKLDKKGDIIVDEYQNSSVKGIYAIGDVQGKWLLTPVAIAAGRRLANRLFGPPELKDDKLSYDDIPSVVFSYVFICSLSFSDPVGSFCGATTQPSPYRDSGFDGTSGATEVWRCCEDLYVTWCTLAYWISTTDSSQTDKTSFRSLYFSMVDEAHKEPTMYKLIVVGPEERVVGVHLLGQGSDEALQGFAVAIKMGGELSFFCLDDLFVYLYLINTRHHSSQKRSGRHGCYSPYLCRRCVFNYFLHFQPCISFYFHYRFLPTLFCDIDLSHFRARHFALNGGIR